MRWGRVPTGSSLIKGHKTPAQGSRQGAWGGEITTPWADLTPPSGCVLWFKYLTLCLKTLENGGNRPTALDSSTHRQCWTRDGEGSCLRDTLSSGNGNATLAIGSPEKPAKCQCGCWGYSGEGEGSKSPRQNSFGGSQCSECLCLEDLLAVALVNSS